MDVPPEGEQVLDVPLEMEKEEILKPDVLEDIHKLWDVFTIENTDEAPIADLITIMKALDVEPDPDEINDLVMQADPNGEQKFTKEALIAIMEEKLRDIDTVEELEKQFMLLDKGGSGRICIPEMKQIMMTMGIKFNEEQAETFLKEAENTKDGYCDYKKLAEKLCPPKPD